MVRGRTNFCLAGGKEPGGEGERLSRDQENGLGMGNRLACVGLTEPFFNFGQEAEPLDGIFERGCIGKLLDHVKDLLFHRFNGHRGHLIRFIL